MGLFRLPRYITVRANDTALRAGKPPPRPSLHASVSSDVILKAHQHKAASRKTTVDIQNYGCNGNLLCYHGVVERNRISSLQSHGKTLEKECCLPGVFCDIVVIRLPISCVR